MYRLFLLLIIPVLLSACSAQGTAGTKADTPPATAAITTSPAPTPAITTSLTPTPAIATPAAPSPATITPATPTPVSRVTTFAPPPIKPRALATKAVRPSSGPVVVLTYKELGWNGPETMKDVHKANRVSVATLTKSLGESVEYASNIHVVTDAGKDCSPHRYAVEPLGLQGNAIKIRPTDDGGLCYLNHEVVLPLGSALEVGEGSWAGKALKKGTLLVTRAGLQYVRKR